MTRFLIHFFVKGADNPQDPAVRERYGVLSGAVGVACNLFLFALKLAIGVATGAISIAADAFNNLSDGLSSVISIVGFKVAAREPDEKHPFGYGRTEYIAGFIVSFLILLVGFEFLRSSVDRIVHPVPVESSGVLIGILSASVLVKLWMGLFNRTIGRRIESPTLLAAMQDSLNDVITTAVVIGGMVAARFTTLPVDGVAGVVVALFILWAGVGIARDTLDPLIGQAADPKVVHRIQEIVMGMPDIVGIHDLIVHSYGVGKLQASLHAEVPADSDFVQIHEVVDEAEKRVWQQTGIFLVIHMDPIAINDERVNALRLEVADTLRGIDPRLSMHDFRVVDGRHRINLIFDVVVPYDYHKLPNGEQELMQQITGALHQRDARYTPVITMDHKM